MTSLLPTGSRPDTVTLRSAKSEESLSSQASGAGEHSVDPTCAQVELGGIKALVSPLNVVLQIGGEGLGFVLFVLGDFVMVLRLGLANVVLAGLYSPGWPHNS